MGNDNQRAHVAIATLWMFTMQVALLVIHCGHIATLPWWLLWMPVMVWVLEIFIVIVLFGAIIVHVTADSIFNNKMIDAICIGGGVVLIVYFLLWAWGCITSFLIGLV